MTGTSRNWTFETVVLVVTVGLAVPAAAQAPAGGSQSRWEVEVHGGGMHASLPTDGSPGTLPGPGQSFVALTGRTTRRASSWYFGDGATLMNQILASFPVTPRITALDPVLGRTAATRNGGASAGARVSYAITPRWGAELSWDRAWTTTQFNDTFLAGVEASRASFIQAWNALIATGGGFVFINPVVTSTVEVADKVGHQSFTTVALTANLTGPRRVVPYVAAGAGAVSYGDQPNVTLTGNYQMSTLNAVAPGRFQVNETDTVTVRVGAKKALVAVVGAGIKTHGSSRWGLRADVRAYLGTNTTALSLDAKPAVATLIPAGVIASTLTPSIQFSNNSSTGHASNLTGPAMNNIEVFKGRGTEIRVSVTAGVFMRF